MGNKEFFSGQNTNFLFRTYFPLWKSFQNRMGSGD